MHASDLHRCNFCNFALAYTERGIIMLNKVTLIDKFRNIPLFAACEYICDA